MPLMFLSANSCSVALEVGAAPAGKTSTVQSLQSCNILLRQGRQVGQVMVSWISQESLPVVWSGFRQTFPGG